MSVVSFLVERHLTAEPCLHFLKGGVIAIHCPFDLLLRSAPRQNHTVEVSVTACLDMNSSFHNGDSMRFPCGKLRQQSLGARTNRRMHQAIQDGQTLRFPEDLSSEFFAIDDALHIQNSAAEFSRHGGRGFASGQKDLVPEQVCFHQQTPMLLEELPNVAFSGRKATRQRDSKHLKKTIAERRRIANPASWWGAVAL
jgi:hypothetical protein